MPIPEVNDIATLTDLKLENLKERVEALEALVSTVRIEIHPSRRVAAHSCWSGTLGQYATLESFVCHGCSQLVSRDFSAILVSYTEDRGGQQIIHTTPPHQQREPSITCKTCGLVSYNTGDIAERFCAKCGRWHRSPTDYLIDTP